MKSGCYLGEPVRIVGPMRSWKRWRKGRADGAAKFPPPPPPHSMYFSRPSFLPAWQSVPDSPVVCAFVEEAERCYEFWNFWNFWNFFSFSVIFGGLWPTACYLDLIVWFVLIELTVFWRDACRIESTRGCFAFIASVLGMGQTSYFTCVESNANERKQLFFIRFDSTRGVYLVPRVSLSLWTRLTGRSHCMSFTCIHVSDLFR